MLAISFLLESCEWVDPYPEYRGVNLLEDRGLSVDDFAESYSDGSGPVGPPAYVTLTTPASYGSTTGLPDTNAATLATIRRLEIPNLIQNGDFADGTTDPWITDGTGLTVNAPDDGGGPGTGFVVESAGVLSDPYIAFEVQPGQGAAVHLDDDVNAMLISVAPGGRYFFQARIDRTADTVVTFDFGDEDTTSYIELDGTSWVFEEPGGSADPGPEEVPDPDVPRLNVPMRAIAPSASPAIASYLYLGSPQGDARAQSGYLDDVRVGRLDNLPQRALTIPIPATGDQLPFVPGSYTFSVYVKSEIDAEVTPAAPNAFRSRQIVLGGGDENRLFERDEYGWSTSTWVKLETVVTLDPDDIAAGGDLVLRLTTIDPLRPAIGRILVALPELVLGTPGE